MKLVDLCSHLNRCKRESAEGEEGWRRRERDGSWRYRFVTTKCASLAATAIFRAKHRVDRLPLAGSNGRVRGTSYCVSVTATTAAIGNKWVFLSATISVVIATVLVSSWCNTVVAEWRGKSRTFWLRLRELVKKMGILSSFYGLTIKYSFFYEFPKNVKVIANFAYMILTLQSLDLDPLSFDIHLISMADIVAQ